MELDDCELPEDVSHLISNIGQSAVAQGTFSDIWKCSLSYESRDVKVDVDVAVKVLRILPYDEDSIEDIRRKFKIWRRTQNEHIVPMLGVANSFAPPRICIVSPWLENGTLTSFLQDKRCMIRKDRLLLLQDIASGLDYLHSVHIVHGDLTGSNVLIDANGRARLKGFGLSSLVNPDEGMTNFTITTRRPALRWAAPELMEDSTHMLPTFGSDIYSFGSVVLQTLSGRLPWSETQNETIVHKKLFEGCHPERPESILDAQWDFIMLCMSLVVESRPSAAEVMEWVKEAVSICNTNTGAANTAPQSTSHLYSRLQLNKYLQSMYGSSMRDYVRWEETEVTGTAGAPAWCCVVHIGDVVHSVGESATKGDAIDTAALHALEILRYDLGERMLGWDFCLLNVALCGCLRSHKTFIERVWADNAAVATRWGHFIDELKAKWARTSVFSAALLAVDVSFIAAPGIYSYSAQSRSTSQIMTYLSLLCAMVSWVSCLILARQVPSRMDIEGAGMLFYKSFLGLDGLALIHNLPFALLIWGTVFFAACVAFSMLIGTNFTLDVE